MHFLYMRKDLDGSLRREIKETYSPPNWGGDCGEVPATRPQRAGKPATISIHTYDMLKLYPGTDFTPYNGRLLQG